MIIGGGTVAYYLASLLLAAGVKVKIIDQSKERCEELSVLLPKAVVVCGDATDQRLLIEEGMAYMDAFVAATGLDEENILLSLLAQTKSNAKTITKVTRINYDHVIESLELDSTINPKKSQPSRLSDMSGLCRIQWAEIWNRFIGLSKAGLKRWSSILRSRPS